MHYTLERPTEGHAEQICAVWASGWHEAHADIVPRRLCELRTENSFRERALENLACTRIAVDGSNLLGFCMVKDDELYQMYVSQVARGSGVAQALIGDAEVRVAANGYDLAWLACAVGNHRAGRFYEKSGWINAGQRRVDLDTSEGAFPLDVWRFEKHVGAGGVS
ncbi:GNAT family N-acetyltransferase [uncultured Tateyamaria sp.]|uniref:GNAT family N-acetyltransferase n=1 Tax=uncultured Tateyamaria sp. TaxID=455651 RepID=UPI00261FB18F|nr:GNAT family N-acetyltransferase [uncultured Tateyamaria sp.]